jgi:hypothetical protein
MPVRHGENQKAKKMTRLLIVIMSLALIFSSCKRKTSVAIYDNVRPKDITVIMDTTSLEFSEMKARFRIKADLNGDRRSFNADIRWDRNNKIWMSFSIFGIEGVRALFTPDSVKVINKLDNEYYFGDYASLTRLSNVELTFEEIEQLLLGKVFEIQDRKPEIDINQDHVVLRLADKEFNAEINLDKETVSIQQFWINSVTAPKRLEVNLSDYQLVGNKKWPNKRDYHIISGDMYLKVDATSHKLVLNEKLDYPFNVHPKYQRIPL